MLYYILIAVSIFNRRRKHEGLQWSSFFIPFFFGIKKSGNVKPDPKFLRRVMP